MYIYWVISITIYFFALVDYFLSERLNSKMLRSYLLFFTSAILIVFGGIRGLGSGADDIEYRNFFNLFHEVIKVYGLWHALSFFRYEPFTYLIAYVTNIFTDNADFFLFLYCSLSVSINAFFFKKLTPYPVFALAIYSSHLFINKDMNQIRFGLSSSLFLGVVYFLSIKDKKGTLSFSLLSFLSHATGIIALIPIFLSKVKITRLPMIIIVSSIPLSYIGSIGFISYISVYLGSVGERAMGYAGSSVIEQGIFSFGNLKNILLVFVFTYYLLNSNLKNVDVEKFRKYFILVTVFSLGGAFRIFFKDYASGGRLANYFLQVEPILLSILIYEMKGLRKHLVIFALLLIVFYYLFYNTIQNHQSIQGYNVDPYFLRVF